jgi:hypothetical protein
VNAYEAPRLYTDNGEMGNKIGKIKTLQAKSKGKSQKAKSKRSALFLRIQKGRSFPNPTFALFNLPFAF